MARIHWFRNLCFGMAFFILLSCVNTPKAQAATSTLLTSSLTISTTAQVVIGSNIFFVATGQSGGEELWKIDTGTNTASMVKDIYSGFNSSSPSDLTAVGSTLFFIANDGVHGRELWKSDGTENGTVLVKDIYSGASNSVGSYSYMVGTNSLAFFRADDGVNGFELWRSDGTENGTTMIEISPGSNKGQPYNSNPYHFINVNGTVYFSANDQTNGQELWKSDGTEVGTVLVKDIASGAGSSDPTMLAVVNGVVFFTAADSAGRELWKSDGTGNGTVMVKDIYSGASSSDPGKSQYQVSVYVTHNNELYFAADDGTNGWELWKSDGTENGTVMVKDIYSGASSSNPGGAESTYNAFTSSGSYVYFSARSSQNDYELWRSDGTENGTTLVKDILAGDEGGFSGSRMMTANSKIYFSAYNDAAVGVELFQSDGTGVGTSFVVDLNTGTPHSYAWPITAVGNVIYAIGSNTPTFSGSYAYWAVDTVATALAGGRSWADTTPPDAPTKLTATSNGKAVTLNWSGPTASDVARIDILRNTGGFSPVDGGNPIDVLPATARTFTDTGVLSGETYTYVIRPRDAAGNLAITEEVKIKVEAPKPVETPLPPVAPVVPTSPAPATPTVPVIPEALTPSPVFTQQDFFANGTPATQSLGQREREALWRDYVAVYDTEPTATALDKMATGIAPSVDIAIEKTQAKNVLPYWRAITGKKTLEPVSTWGFGVYSTLIYRVRYERDLKKEIRGIQKFRRAFRRAPSSPLDWAAVRAWGYLQ